MGTINFNALININRLALVNEPETEEEEFEQSFYNYELEEIQEELDKNDFYYFNLSINFGYYRGFCLKLENNTKYIYQNSKEKAEVLKELTAIKKVLLELIKKGLLWGCYPSWIYNKLPTAETIKQVNAIIKELKQETKRSYTEKTASKTNKSIFDIVKEIEQRRK